MRIFLIGLGILDLFVSVPTMIHSAKYGGWIPKSIWEFTPPAVGIALIIAGVFYRKWAPRWLSSR